MVQGTKSSLFGPVAEVAEDQIKTDPLTISATPAAAAPRKASGLFLAASAAAAAEAEDVAAQSQASSSTQRPPTIDAANETEVVMTSAGSASSIKSLFEQKAKDAARKSSEPEKKVTWKPNQHTLDLPNSSSRAAFRAHEAPFVRGAAIVGEGPPKQRSLQDLLKSDEQKQQP